MNISGNLRKIRPLRPVPLRTVFVLSLLILLFPSDGAAASTVRYVAPDGNCGGASPCYATIQAAIDAAARDDEIRVATGVYSQVSTGYGITAVARIYHKVLTLRGGYTTANWSQPDPAANLTTIDAQNKGIGVYITYNDLGSGHITVEGFRITGGNATDAVAGTDKGGGIFANRTQKHVVVIRDCWISGNDAESVGAGVAAWYSHRLHVENSQILDNKEKGIYVNGDSPVITGNTIARNEGDGIFFFQELGGTSEIRNNVIADNKGSGIDIASSTGGVITGNTITGNVTESEYPGTSDPGGGIDFSGNNYTISDNTIRDNSAGNGGGIRVGGYKVVVTGNRIESNHATSMTASGGGIYANASADGSDVTVRANTIISNASESGGGGITALGFVDVLDNTISGNTAQSGGGIQANITGLIGGNTIAGNAAVQGAGLNIANPMGTGVRGNLFSDNYATSGNGGAIYLYGALHLDVWLDGNRMIGNTAHGKGGGLYMECPTPNPIAVVPISNTVAAGNAAATGSGIFNDNCTFTLRHTTLADNQATGADGVVADGVGFYTRMPTGSDTPDEFTNSIVVRQPVGVFVESGAVNIHYTLWGTKGWANGSDTAGSGTIDLGTVNLHDVPMFVDPAAGNYHIMQQSPAVGHGMSVGVTTDMDGEARPTAGPKPPDLGADEYHDPLGLLYLPCQIRFRQ